MKPVRIVVGFAPGGGTDPLARLIGQWLSERLGQPFLVRSAAAAPVARQGATGGSMVMDAPPCVHIQEFCNMLRKPCAARASRWNRDGVVEKIIDTIRAVDSFARAESCVSLLTAKRNCLGGELPQNGNVPNSPLLQMAAGGRR